jgi:hypothetical protein
MGLVWFLSTVPGDYFLLDQIVVLIAEIQGSTAATFCELPVADEQKSISEYFLVNSGYIRKSCLWSIIFPMSYDPCFHWYSLQNQRTVFLLQQIMMFWHFLPSMQNVYLAWKLETAPQKLAKECTQQSEISKNVKASFAVSMNDSHPLATTVQKSTYRGGRCKVSDAPRDTRKVPAALEAHKGWSIIGTAHLDESEFSTKSDFLDNLLSAQVYAYTAKVRQQLRAKLRNNDLEVNELNVFSLFLSSSLDYILEYPNELLARKGHNCTSTYEFRCFLGTFLLLSSFNFSTNLKWNLMQKITGDKAKGRDRFNELMKNLSGFETGMHFGGGPALLCMVRSNK